MTKKHTECGIPHAKELIKKKANLIPDNLKRKMELFVFWLDVWYENDSIEYFSHDEKGYILHGLNRPIRSRKMGCDREMPEEYHEAADWVLDNFEYYISD